MLNFNRDAWAYFLRLHQRSMPSLLLSVTGSIALAILTWGIAVLIGYTIDAIIPREDLRPLGWISLAIIILYILNAFLALLIRRTSLRVNVFAIQRLREDLLAKFYQLPRAYYSKTEHGQLHTTLVVDTRRLNLLSAEVFPKIVPALIRSTFLLALLVYVDPVLAALLLFTMPVLLVANRTLGRRVKEHVKRFRRKVENYNTGILFLLDALDLTHLQSAEDYELERHRLRAAELSEESERGWLTTAYSSLLDTMVVSSGIVMLFVGGIRVENGSISVGVLVSFFVLLSFLARDLRTVWVSVPLILEGNESLVPVYEFLSLAVSKPYSGIKKIAFEGRIDLEDLWFRYESEWVLQDIRVSVQPEQIVTLMGPNGAGKTTIIQLISGLYRPQKGRLSADKHPYDELDMDQLRRLIRVVPQDPLIFAGTVLENICYGSPQSSIPQAATALRIAGGEALLSDLPQDLETSVGERGVRLSGGQRQMLAIARAILNRPKLLILDEPGNHLDYGAIQRLVQNLRQLQPAPSILVISHRSGFLQLADRAYYLDHGRIIVQGKPDEVEEEMKIENKLAAGSD